MGFSVDRIKIFLLNNKFRFYSSRIEFFCLSVRIGKMICTFQ